jgi:hypothetical protein
LDFLASRIMRLSKFLSIINTQSQVFCYRILLLNMN